MELMVTISNITSHSDKIYKLNSKIILMSANVDYVESPTTAANRPVMVNAKLTKRSLHKVHTLKA
jgi:hypothetical protein